MMKTSETLGSDERVHEIDEQTCGHDSAQDIIDEHGVPHKRSHSDM
jgi:hypothetical protein